MIKIGFGEENITPSFPVFLAGYASERISKEVHDEIYVRTITINYQEEKFFCLVNFDLVAIDDLIIDKVKKYFKNIEIIFCATHTHSSIAGIINSEQGILKGSDYIFGKINDYLINFIAEKTCKSIEKSIQDLKDGEIFKSSSFLSGISSNRNNKNLHGDNNITVYYLYQIGFDKAIIYNFSCHPTILNFTNLQISADFPGMVNYLIKKEGYKFATFLNGSCGDISTRFTKIKKGFEEVERVGNIIKDKIKDLQNKKEKIQNIFEIKKFSTKLLIKAPITIGYAKKIYEDCLSALNKAKEENKCSSEIRVLESRLEGAEANLVFAKSDIKLDSYKLNLSTIKFGEDIYICIPGELFSELSNLIKRKNIHFICYCDGYAGYFANEFAYDNHFYEALASPFKKGEGEKMINYISEKIL